MRDIVKILLIPIVGCVAIGIIFLLIVYGGRYEGAVDNSDARAGLAVAELGGVDDTLTITGECDPLLYTPVCGYDGVTYDNPCYAVQAGTRVAHRGQCA